MKLKTKSQAYLCVIKFVPKPLNDYILVIIKCNAGVELFFYGVELFFYKSFINGKIIIQKAETHN